MSDIAVIQEIIDFIEENDAYIEIIKNKNDEAFTLQVISKEAGKTYVYYAYTIGKENCNDLYEILNVCQTRKYDVIIKLNDDECELCNRNGKSIETDIISYHKANLAIPCEGMLEIKSDDKRYIFNANYCPACGRKIVNSVYRYVWISGKFISNNIQYYLDVRLDGISEDEFNKVKNTDVSFHKENNDIYIQCIVDDKEINIKETERDKWNIGEEGDMYRTSKTWKEILNKDLPAVELEEGYFILKY